MTADLQSPANPKIAAPAACDAVGGPSQMAGRFGGWLVCAGCLMFVWAGSDRIPADPTSVLNLQGEVRSQPHARDTLRLATFNIHGGRGHQAAVDLERTAECLQTLDFIGIYEVHGGLGSNQADALGTLLGMRNCFVPTERRWWHDHFGNGILSRLPLSGLYRLPLECTQGKKYRNAVLSVIDLPSGSVRILSVHLDRRRDRRRQLEAVTRLFLSLESPAVLMGDLNTTRSDAVLKQTLQHPDVIDVLADTEFEDDPRRIDWMLVRGLRCRNAELIDNRSSDHPVIRAELEWISRRGLSEHHAGKN